MHIKRCGRITWINLFIYSFVLLSFKTVLSYPERRQGPYYDSQRNGPTSGGNKPAYVDLCNTAEGMKGQCHPVSECWVLADYDNIELQKCDWDTENDFYCCPDLTEENVDALSPNKQQRPQTTTTTTTQRPTIDPIKGIMDIVGSWFQPHSTRGVHPPTVPPRVFPTRSPITRTTPRRTTRRPTQTLTTVRTTRRTVATARPTQPRRTTPQPVLEPDYQQGCGQKPGYDSLIDARRKDPLDPFVVGGIDAEDNSWPWMVSIHKSRDGGKYRFLCGGSLITPRHVLTAAHCFDTRKGNLRHVVGFGSNNVTSEIQQELYADAFIGVSDIRVHELYKPRVYYHDIAIITLHGSVSFDEKVSPICLPTSQDLKSLTPGSDVILTGWGYTQYGGKISQRLQEAFLKVVLQSRCRESYGKFETESLFQGITTSMICAGRIEGGADACQGDSGGPLVMYNGGNWFQIGVVSFGFRCGAQDFPGVYTRVSSYVDWINLAIEE